MMKNIMKYICLLAMMMVAVPMMGQDYLTVYFKDGSTERHLMRLIDKSIASKVDDIGELHSDYVAHRIEMLDGKVYTYNFANIDSIAFEKVDVQKLAEDIQMAEQYINELTNECQTVELLESKIDEINSNNFVEKAYSEEGAFVIKIKNWHNVVFLKDIDEYSENATRNRVQMKRKSYSREMPKIECSKDIKVVVANQRSDDPLYALHTKNYVKSVYDDFLGLGYDVDYKDYLDMDFFKDGMFDYNIVYLVTHGGYINGQHWFLTSEVLDTQWFDTDKPDDIASSNDLDMWDIFPRSYPAGVYTTFYKGVSESYIASGNKKFPESPHNLVFNAACSSMRGNYSFAEKMVDEKGTNVYLGYSQDNLHGTEAGRDFFRGFLKGQSSYVSYNNISEDLRGEVWGYGAHLVGYGNNCFSHPVFTEEVNQNNVYVQYANSHSVEVCGIANTSDKSAVDFGFVYEVDGGQSVYLRSEEGFAVNSKKGNYLFRTLIPNLTVGQKVTCRAFVFDGEDYNYGNFVNFYIPNLITSLTITSPTTTMDLCEVKSIEYHFTPIDADNKTMEWTSSDPSIVTVDQNGIATAFKTGTCTITVKTTDGSNLSATCTITVTENGGPKTDQPEVSGTSATLYGHHTCIGDYLRGFAYWEEGHEDRKTFVNSLSTGIAFSSGVSDLKENTTYYYQAVCTHYEHNFYANIVKFTTGSASTPDTGTHEYVDLGLSVKWATCNVGASKPEEYGDYFAWGETAPKNDYSGDTYFDVFSTEYNGYGDKYQLDSEDDAATVRLGANWRIPTYEEFRDLMNECTWTWTTKNGVNGYEVTGPSGKSIFMPAAGYRMGNELRDEGSCGNYWIDYVYVLPFANATGLASCVSFSSNNVRDSYNYAPSGLTIRPVYSEIPRDIEVLIIKVTGDTKEIAVGETIQLSAKVLPVNASVQEVRWQSSDESIASVSNTGVVTGKSAGKVTIYAVSTDGHNAKGRYELTITNTESTHEYVDLGLSVKWATCNIGANSPEEYGDYFAWGETSPKEVYDNKTFFDNKFEKYNNEGGKTVLELEDDAAHVNWGGSWRIPTYDELSELRNNCTWTWTAQNGVMGCEIVSNKNGNSIFLPAVGIRWDSSLLGAGSSGNYWTSSIKQDDSSNANCLYFGSSDWYWYGNYRYGGRAIRPVCP